MMMINRDCGGHRRSDIHLFRRARIVTRTSTKRTEDLLGQDRSLCRRSTISFCSPPMMRISLIQSLRNIAHDRFIYLICLIVLLSYLPGKSPCLCLSLSLSSVESLFLEAGQYSCFFMYLRLVRIVEVVPEES